MIDFVNDRSVNQSQVIGVVSRALRHIDPRLVEHGERVAYLAGRIADQDPTLQLDRDKLLILCLLHDVGAYKTEEIDNMVRFETGDVTNHAVYGYVFLRNITTLDHYAEAILYHHTDIIRLRQADTRHKLAAALIFLADRIDILLATDGEPDWQELRAQAGSVFSPRLMELFFAAEAAEHLSAHIRDGSFRREVEPRLNDLPLSAGEIMSYLQLLVFSIDFRSPHTVTHTANTTAIAACLAQLAGLDDTERQAVALGAFLHDVGKIAIPVSILENPGKLAPADMAIMRTHVAVSEEILSGVVTEPVCRIAVRHHEKLNGSGYHRGLAAADLTAGERIVAVADVLSALIGRRSYKVPFPKERTLAILADMENAGELCPAICQLAAEHYDHILQVVARADDPVIRLYETLRSQYQELQARFAP